MATTLQKIPTNRTAERRRFDESKAGVKGLVDGGIAKVPAIFRHPPETHFSDNLGTNYAIPTVDLQGVDDDDSDHRQRIATQIRDAAESWGIFRVVNHGIPRRILDDVIRGARDFHELEIEAKTRFYSREHRDGLVYCSNPNLFTLPVAEWRDTFSCSMAPVAPAIEDLPAVCGGILIEFGERVMQLGRCLFRLMSEGLGLGSNRLLEIGCDEGLTVIGHYYPACPEPEATLGIRRHSDSNFLTILVQDNLGGLQVLHKDKWVNVEPLSGSLVVNVGSILQMITNDKLKSVEHRVLAKSTGPRVSVASFFSTGRNPSSRVYSPIEELLSEEDPPRYPALTFMDFYTCFKANACDGSSTLRHLKL
ncbi:1-aminocyclopropane-1-carboxylate oxidase homolog 1-like [Andrographis paniculata]|uniref:1-aminocyclopropane-1-carboxylate oxidase homolog 1-like n=1 Tax=Andrographis paniculata TaxID=175694 RepID=UPI0021E6DEAD|nr:1-aminocyclopropane-1-carboxylate oxidase homolog 1-like [Andrographis paniculata]